MSNENQTDKGTKISKVSAVEAQFLGAVDTFQKMGFSNQEIAKIFCIKPKSTENKLTESIQEESVPDTKSS